MVTAAIVREARGWLPGQERTRSESFRSPSPLETGRRKNDSAREASICDLQCLRIGHRQDCLCYLGNGTDFAGEMADAFAHVF